MAKAKREAKKQEKQAAKEQQKKAEQRKRRRKERQPSDSEEETSDAGTESGTTDAAESSDDKSIVERNGPVRSPCNFIDCMKLLALELTEQTLQTCLCGGDGSEGGVEPSWSFARSAKSTNYFLGDFTPVSAFDPLLDKLTGQAWEWVVLGEYWHPEMGADAFTIRRVDLWNGSHNVTITVDVAVEARYRPKADDLSIIGRSVDKEGNLNLHPAMEFAMTAWREENKTPPVRLKRIDAGPKDLAGLGTN
jgi:hypothetical protein